MRTKLSEGIKIQAIVEIRDKNGKLKSVSKSKVGNLILDNFGKLLAGLIRAPVSALSSVSLKNVDGVAKSFYSYSSGGVSNYTFNNALTVACDLGTLLQIGSGSTPPLRSDFSIETPFGISPESGRFDTGTGSYVDGVITFSGSITAGGSGTIREVGFFATWMDVGVQTIMLFHDAISPAKPFIPNDSITVTYHITL